MKEWKAKFVDALGNPVWPDSDGNGFWNGTNKSGDDPRSQDWPCKRAGIRHTLECKAVCGVCCELAFEV